VAFREVATKCLEQLRQIAPSASPGGEWKRVDEQNGVTISSLTQSPVVIDSPYDTVRGDGDIPLPPDVVQGLVRKDGPERLKWQGVNAGQALLDSRVLESFGDDLEIVYRASKSPAFIVTDRDLVLVKLISTDPDGTIWNVLTSVSHPAQGEQKGFVRMKMVLAGVILRPTSNGHTHMTAITNADPCGSIPAKIVKTGQTRSAMVVDVIRTSLAKGFR